jgi:ribonuclease D
LAELYQESGHKAEAIRHLVRAMGIANDPAVLLSLCELYAQTDQWDRIVDSAKHVTPEDDITLQTMTFYGRALQESNLNEAAISVFTQALRKKKDRSTVLLQEAQYWRAISYEKVGKRSQAQKEFQKLYAQAPDFRDVEQRLLPTQ